MIMMTIYLNIYYLYLQRKHICLHVLVYKDIQKCSYIFYKNKNTYILMCSCESIILQNTVKFYPNQILVNSVIKNRTNTIVTTKVHRQNSKPLQLLNLSIPDIISYYIYNLHPSERLLGFSKMQMKKLKKKSNFRK